MKAFVLKELNKPLVLEEVETPQPIHGQLLIQLKASAVNHRDVFITKGLYAGISLPVILGSDGSGVVHNEGLKFKKGDEVIINPSFNWGDSEKVQSKKYNILGLPANGTMSEFICIGEENIYSKPAHLSFEQAAALPLAGLTAYRVLISRAQLKPGEKVLITGIGGGVALFVMQFALALGAEVYVTSGSDDKLQHAMTLGAKGGANYRQDDWQRQLQASAGGFDVIIDSAGGDGFNKLIDLANPGGRIAFYGGTKGNFNNVSPQKIFWKQLSILGSTMGSDKDFAEMITLINDKKIIPVIDTVYPFNQANEAMQRMDKGEQFGKIVIKCG